MPRQVEFPTFGIPKSDASMREPGGCEDAVQIATNVGLVGSGRIGRVYAENWAYRMPEAELGLHE